MGGQVEVPVISSDGPRFLPLGMRSKKILMQFGKLKNFLCNFFTLKISTYLYDWRTPEYLVAHPAYPVGPSLVISDASGIGTILVVKVESSSSHAIGAKISQA